MTLQGLRWRASFGRRMSAALGALAAVGVLGLAAVTTGVAAAGTASGPTVRPHAAEEAFQCTVLGVAAYTSRIHVRCADGVDRDKYFAVSTANGAHADRVLQVATAAMTAGRAVTIWFDPYDESAAEAVGCRWDDCRLLLGIDM